MLCVYKKTESLIPLKKNVSLRSTSKKEESDAAQIHEKMKFNIQLITAAVLSIGGLVLLFCGVYIDPQGQIHETLLIGFGEVVTFAGAIMGVDYTYKHKNNQDQ